MNLFDWNFFCKNFFFRSFRPELGVCVWELFTNMTGSTCCEFETWWYTRRYWICGIKKISSRFYWLEFLWIICLADYLQEVKTFLSSFLFSILSKEMLLLRIWPHLPFCLVGWFISIASERTVEPFCVTCFVISLRCVLCFGIARKCMHLACGGVSTGFPGHNVSESNVFSTAMDTFIFITC